MARKKQSASSTDPTEHLAQKPFAAMLEQFTAMNPSSTNMFGSGMSPAATRDMRADSKRKKSQDEDDGYERDLALSVLDEDLSVESLSAERQARDAEDDFLYLEDFDQLIEGTFASDEDVALRNQLVSMGRKYAIQGLTSSQEESEVSRAYSKQEQAIYGLIEEYQKTGMDLQRDIDFLRTMRSRNYKSLAEMVEVQATLLNGKLSAIKELSKIAKDKFDISIKLKAGSAGDGDSSTAASRAIQQIFSTGRAAMATYDSPGDSWATEEEYSTGDYSPGGADYSDGRAESAIQQAQEIPEASTDGEKFIKYEHTFGDYVLDIGEDGSERNIYAIDRQGDIIPDYPMPSDVQALSFSINELTGTATDQLQRRYKVRKNGVDLVEDGE